MREEHKTYRGISRLHGSRCLPPPQERSRVIASCATGVIVDECHDSSSGAERASSKSAEKREERLQLPPGPLVPCKKRKPCLWLEVDSDMQSSDEEGVK